MARYNLIGFDPSFEQASPMFVAAGAGTTVSRSSAFADTGTYSVLISPNGSNASAVYPFGSTASATALCGFTMNGTTQYTVSATIRVGKVQTGTLSTIPRLINIQTVVGGVANTQFANSASAPNTVGTYRLSVTFTVPLATQAGDFCLIRLMNGSATVGDLIYWDSLMVEAAPSAGTYFDGDTADTSTVNYAWTGTAQQSQSIASPVLALRGTASSQSAGTAIIQDPRPTYGTASLVDLESLPPIRITLYDKSLTRKGFVGNPQGFNAVIRTNTPGQATFTVDADHPQIGNLSAGGARAVIEYRYSPNAPLETLISGPLEERTGAGVLDSATRTFSISDDWNLFNYVLGWPSPSQPITNQGSEAKFWTVTGSAEYVTKWSLQANASRLPYPVTIPANQSRGSTVTASYRFQTLADRLFPAVDTAGLLVRVLQLGTAITVVTTVPNVVTRVLTEESGIISEGSFTITPPVTTRVIASTASGEGVTRAFREFINTAAETKWGYKRAAFVEVSGDDATLETLMAQQAQQLLVDQGEKVTLAVTLVETDTFRYGRTYGLGDQVTIKLAGADPITDRVMEVAFDWSTSDGLVITPTVGGFQDSTATKLIKTVATLARTVRDIQRSR